MWLRMDDEEIIQPALWSEQNFQQFIDYAEYFVPNRREQMEIICQLILETGWPTWWTNSKACYDTILFLSESAWIK